MSDIEALKKEKQELIDKMVEMQKQFIAYEHEHGVTGKAYWASSDGLLANYRHEYADMANRVVDLAHQIVGSARF
jgi:enoyl reductase-like protein